MKRNSWKLVIIIDTLSIIIFLIFLFTQYFVEINPQPTQTQIVKSNHTQEESITIVSPMVTENVSATQEVWGGPLSLTRSDIKI